MSYFLSYSPTNLMKGGNTINCEVNNKNRNKKSLNYIYIYIYPQHSASGCRLSLDSHYVGASHGCYSVLKGHINKRTLLNNVMRDSIV